MVDIPSSVVPLQNPVVFLQHPPSECILPICDYLDEEEEEEEEKKRKKKKKKRIFKQFT